MKTSPADDEETTEEEIDDGYTEADMRSAHDDNLLHARRERDHEIEWGNGGDEARDRHKDEAAERDERP